MRTLYPVSSTLSSFEVARASFPGRQHQRTARNNQDAVAIVRGQHGISAVVTDGCSAGQHSEFGARLGAYFLAASINRRLTATTDPADPAWIQHLGRSLRQLLGTLSRLLSPSEGAQRAVVAETMLFGFLAAIITPRFAVILGIGDGVWAINGNVFCIDPGPANAPPYIAYGLVSDLVAGPSPRLAPLVHFAGATTDVRSLLIATDGAIQLEEHARRPMRDGKVAGGLEQFMHPRYRKNPTLVQKRLRAISEQAGPLDDDLTLALITRHSSQSDTAAFEAPSKQRLGPCRW